MARQLPLPLDLRPAFRREDFIVGPSNEAAVRFVDRWPDWPSRIGALYGPAGSGKSYLVEVWRVATHGQSVPAAELSMEWVGAAAQGMAVAVEDIDQIEAGLSEEQDRALLALFERPEGTMLLSGSAPPTSWPTATGDLRSRFASLLAFPMALPDDSLLAGLARKLFADRQLSVSDAVVARMVSVLERTPAAIADFVVRADRKALAERRPVSERLVRDVLDGMEQE